MPFTAEVAVSQVSIGRGDRNESFLGAYYLLFYQSCDSCGQVCTFVVYLAIPALGPNGFILMALLLLVTSCLLVPRMRDF